MLRETASGQLAHVYFTGRGGGRGGHVLAVEDPFIATGFWPGKIWAIQSVQDSIQFMHWQYPFHLVKPLSGLGGKPFEAAVRSHIDAHPLNAIPFQDREGSEFQRSAFAPAWKHRATAGLVPIKSPTVMARLESARAKLLPRVAELKRSGQFLEALAIEGGNAAWWGVYRPEVAALLNLGPLTTLEDAGRYPAREILGPGIGQIREVWTSFLYALESARAERLGRYRENRARKPAPLVLP